MSFSATRCCPLCGAKAVGVTFPYATKFNNQLFSYLQCGGCDSVFVDPVPDAQTFARMYAKAAYHDCHYENNDGDEYVESVQLLKKYLSAGASVLDYGCGVGAFLKALVEEGFNPVGVEFDRDAALRAGTNANCRTMSVEDYWEQTEKQLFDAIHFGDVLEHLHDPEGIIRKLLEQLKPGGVLFVEGPLEINPSPVYWSAKVFGVLKHLLRPNFVATDPPTHLFRTGGRQQLQFFSRVDPNLHLKVWSVYETGWPYANGNPIKHLIARLAKSIGGKKMFGESFGNRFRGVFVKSVLVRTVALKASVL